MSKINDTELRALLDEVAEDLQKAFADSKETLVKGEESSSMAKDFPPEASGSASSASEGSAPAAAPAPEASASGSGSESASESSGSSAGEMGAPEGAEGAPGAEGQDPAAEQGAELTPEALQAEYSKLSPEELEMHIHAALAAKEAAMGAAGAGDAGAPAAAPMAPPAAPAPDMGAPGPAMKAEGAGHKSGGQMSAGKMAKSETSSEVELLKAQLKAQSEDIETLTKVVTALGEQPIRKSIVSVRPEAPKAEAKDISKLTMKDVSEHLSKLTQRPDLKKSDRDLINDFYERRASIDKLAPLFENYGK